MAIKAPTTRNEITEKPIAASSDVEKLKINIHGTESKDYLSGNGGDNFMYGLGGDDVFYGSAGADELHGSYGSDTAYYYNSKAGVQVDLQSGIGKGGDAQGDRYVSIENATGSSYRDFLYGDDSVNILKGLDGNDYLYGRGGDDKLYGGNGKDVLNGGTGADYLNGGSGEDTASYSGSANGVIADLAQGGGSYGDAYGDTYIGIENLTGSNHIDSLWGDEGANTLTGLGGGDALWGRDGDDTLDGGAGDDKLVGGNGADHLIGGSGRDEANYTDSDTGVTVQLSGTSTGGTAQGDTYNGVEDARGSAYSDHFYGTSGDNRFFGENGNDVFHGDAGADTFYGGSGTDTADYRSSTSAVTVNLATGTGSGGDANGDTYSSIENIVGSEAAENTLIGNNGDNKIVSYGLDDIVEGGGGADELEIRGLFKKADGGEGDDTITIIDSKEQGIWEAQYHSIYTDTYTRDGQYSEYLGSAQFDNGVEIDGGEGVDTVDFSLSSWVNVGTNNLTDHGGVSVSLHNNTFTFEGHHYNGETSNLGTNLGDKHVTKGFIFNVENVDGTQYDDHISGNDADNHFVGGGGSDWLWGQNGNDILEGGSGDDELNGGANDDILIGGAGADKLEGGSGIDTISYQDSGAVQVSLNAQTAAGSHAEGDTISGIENIIGSNAGDTLVGDANSNVLDGSGGDDILDGSGGDDFLIGGSGADEFVFRSDFQFSDDHVTIEDFELGQDTLNLSHLNGIDTIQDVYDNLSQSGTDTIYTHGDSTITIENTMVWEFTEGDFLI